MVSAFNNDGGKFITLAIAVAEYKINKFAAASRPDIQSCSQGSTILIINVEMSSEYLGQSRPAYLLFI